MWLDSLATCGPSCIPWLRPLRNQYRLAAHLGPLRFPCKNRHRQVRSRQRKVVEEESATECCAYGETRAGSLMKFYRPQLLDLKKIEQVLERRGMCGICLLNRAFFFGLGPWWVKFCVWRGTVQGRARVRGSALVRVESKVRKNVHKKKNMCPRASIQKQEAFSALAIGKSNTLQRAAVRVHNAHAALHAAILTCILHMYNCTDWYANRA